MWGSGFLPSTHQGVPFRESGDPILHTSNPKGIDMRGQRDSLDLIRKLNAKRLDVDAILVVAQHTAPEEGGWRGGAGPTLR